MFNRSSVTGSALNPVIPPGSGHSMLNPVIPPGSGHSMLNPVIPPGSGHSMLNPVIPPGSGESLPGQPVWQGVDPAWTYGQGNALLAQALRKVRSRIAPVADPRLAPPTGETAAPRPDEVAPLWRWQPLHRVQAIVGDLLGRVVLEGRTLWLLDRRGAPPAVSPLPLFGVDRPAGLDLSLQVDKVLRAAIEREDRLPEILSQAEEFWLFFDAITGIDRRLAPRTGELLEVALSWGTHLLMGLKNELAEARPVRRSSLVHPVIATPGHGSLPSGHATVATLGASVLTMLLGGPAYARAGQLDLLARRIAFNRVVAGVHFPMDSALGHALGLQLARAMEALAVGGGAPVKVEVGLREDSDLPELRQPGEPNPLTAAHEGGPAVQAAPGLATLWSAARAELDALRV